MVKLAKRVDKLVPSLTRKLFDMAKRSDGVFDLTLGDPDVLPPREARAAACRAIEAGRTRYSHNAGVWEARAAVAKFNAAFYGRRISPEEVILTCGGMGALHLLLFSLVQKGDEVIIPAPYWVNYENMTRLFGAKPVIVPTREEDNFALTADALEKAITKRTRVLILNSPNNPSGRVIPGPMLDRIARLAVRHDLFVISDEVYRSLLYDGRRHESIWTRPGMRSRCAVVDSMSKRFSMTGYRLGMAIAPKDLVAKLAPLQECVVSCAPLPSQYAALAGYSGKAKTAYLLKEFSARREAVLAEISKTPRLSLSAIDGTFYAFVNIAKTGLKSMDFAVRLLERERVAVIPGLAFGADYDNYIRIAFTVGVPRLRQALRRLRRFVLSLPVRDK